MKHVFDCIGHELKIPDIVNSEGVYITDGSGKLYMDLESGVWCISLGHSNRRVNTALKRQLDSIVQAGFSYSSLVVDEAAARVLDVTGLKGGKCVFLCSGSEAIEMGRQISRHLTGFKLSMTLHDSYLGAYSSVSDRSSGWYQFDWSACEKCPSRNDCPQECELLEQIPEGISEFVFEPGSSSGFVRFPPAAMIRNLTGIVRENGGKILVNEVTTGAGRTGKWFGYQHYPIKPDLIAMGKGIGNGYPVSVAVISQDMVQDLDKKPFRYAQSHQNDPLGAVVVKEVIDSIEDYGLIKQAEQIGARLKKRLEQLVDGQTILGVRGRGLMLAVDVSDKKTTERIHNQLITEGYIVGNRGSHLRIDPPLTIAEDEMEQFTRDFAKILQK